MSLGERGVNVSPSGHVALNQLGQRRAVQPGFPFCLVSTTYAVLRRLANTL
jgi:hypothetical protein